ncbi:MAG: acyltransferase family protein [Vagococcus sp.]|uniref:acyltransferase family protein n=1 Tax=Vagococcus sp. TaxID=1933889 RepID=UPI002FCB7752
MKKYYSGLDTLRTVAILFVILYHTMPQIFQGGFLGVNLFFVLSGFLMTGIILSELYATKTFNFEVFYKKRLKRIYPSMIFLIITLFIYVIFSQSMPLWDYVKDGLASLLGLNNQWQLVNQVSYFDQFKTLYLLKHLWSLSMEIQFYIFYPLILHFIFIKQKRANKLIGIEQALVIATLVSIITMSFLYFYVDVSFAYYSTVARLFSFTIGGLFFIKSITRKERINKNYPIKVAVCALLLLLLFLRLNDHSVLTYNGGMVIFSLISGYLIFFTVESKMINQKLSSPVLSFIGKRSYDMYLFYLPVIVIFQHHSKWDGKNPIIMTLILIGLIVAFGHLSFHITEKYSPKDIGYSIIVICSLISLLVSFNTLQKTLIKKANMEKQTVETTTSRSKKTTPSSEKETTETTVINEPQHLFFVGDSVLLGASDTLKATFDKDSVEVDAKVGRQPYEIQEIIENHDSSDTLTYIISTGNNGLLTKDELDNLLKTIGKQDVYFITTAVPRPWKTASNDTLKNGIKKNKNAHIIDWEKKVSQQPDNEWFDGDDIHLNAEGAKVYSDLIQSSIKDNK